MKNLKYQTYKLKYKDFPLEYNLIKTLPHDYGKDYLTFEALEDGTFTLSIDKDNYGVTLDITSVSYSIDNGETWVTTERDANSITVITTPQITSGNKVLWKGIAKKYGSSGPGDGIRSRFSSNNKFNIYGNIQSMTFGDEFVNNSTVYKYNYFGLFKDTKVVSAYNLKLPATTLADSCYHSMFYGCTNLTKIPELIATTLADECYSYMFSNCTTLSTAPELPVTTLSRLCYSYMFENCTSLTTAPELSATTLANGCYYRMFLGCTSLVTAPELPATTLVNECYSEMFSGCTNLTTAPELPVTTLARLCYSSMFYGCTGLTLAPELPATTLADSCYSNMFKGCRNLISAPELSATTLASGCYSGMFSNCSSLTSAPELPATTLVDACYNDMFNGCTNLNYIKAMFITIPSNSLSTRDWVKDVASTGTFVKNSAAEWDMTGNHGIPTGWTVETADTTN